MAASLNNFTEKLISDSLDTDEVETQETDLLESASLIPLNEEIVHSTTPVQYDEFNKYFHAPYLTEEEEIRLAKEFTEQGSIKAAHSLVLSHMRYVVKVAKSYVGYGLPLTDIVQEGAIGLMKAVKKFNPTMGVRLVTFAVYWIKSEIHEYILKNWKLVKIATTKAQRKLFFNLRKLKNEYEDLTPQEQLSTISKKLDVSTIDVEEMSQRMYEHDIEIDKPVFHDGPTTYGELIPADQFSPEMMVIKSSYQEDIEHLIPKSFAGLTIREQDIIRKRYLSDDKLTLKELADFYGISLERVRQLEKNALSKLKESLLTKGISQELLDID
jgi:RNA polymerase sigma-32 factor